MTIYPLIYALYYLQVLCTCCDFNVIPLVNFWIEENIEKGTFIGQLSSSPASVASLSPIDSKYASTSTCAYTSLAQQPISNYFHIDSNDGGIYALRKIDREALCSEEYVLERIRKHINDKTPKSGDLSHNNTRSIDENSNSVKHIVLSNNNQTNQESQTTISVTTNATRHYRNVNHAVDISQTSTATTSVCQIKFQVLISDTTGIKSKSNMLQNVQITISDLNDNIPQFNVQNFTLKIPESSPIDAEFRLPQANDMDTGVNGISEYRLVPCIHETVGDEMLTSHPLHMCHKQEMNLVQKYSETSVFIDLNNNNNNNNNIKRSSSSAYTEESLSKNYAGDYFMLKTNLLSDGRLQPILKQIRLLDREQVAWLYLCLIAVDGGGQQGFTCGYIEIIDANDNVPQWIDLPYRVSVSECEPDKQNIYVNSNNNMFQSQIPSLRQLYTLKAKDSDSGIYGQITYRLAPSTMTGHKRLLHNQPKVIIKEDKLYLLSKLDYEQLTKFVVYVEAVDGGGLVNFTDVEVTVEDCNDHAPTIMLIPVRSSSRTTTTTTNNINNKTYGISKTNINSMLSFPVLPTSNMDLWMEEENYDQIKLATIMSFDRDRKDNGRVTCYLDKSGQFLDSFDYSQIFELLSNQPTISAISSSSSSSITPTVTTDEDFSSMKQTDIYGNITLTNKPSIFSLYKKSGIKVDREENQKLLFDIVCTDNGEVNPQITRRTVHVFIGDINDNPPQILTTNDLLNHAASSRDKEVERPFISQVFSVSENEPFGTYVGTVIAKDIDEGINSKLLYSFMPTSVENSVSESDSKDVFEIDKLTGRITTRVPLDRETQSSYLLNVQVMDSGEPPLSSTCYIQINVADVNDMPPIFETSDPSGRIVFQVTESVGNRRVHGRLVGRLKAYDNDMGSNQTIRFAFVNGSLFPNQLPVTYRISLDGHIYADGIMDREAYKEHQFTVIAVDGASTHHQLTSTAVVLVTLLDINDNPPQFIYPPSTTSNKIPSDLINITVDTSPGTILYSVRVTDLDEPQNTKINFALHSARFLSDYFTLKQNDVHISETDGYTEVNADLILVNSLTQLLPTYKVKHTRTGDSGNKKLTGEAAALPALTKVADIRQQHHYPTEYFLYIIVKDSDKDSGFTSTARLRIHVYTDSTSLYPLYSSSITSSRHRSNVSTASELLQAKNFEMYKQHSDGGMYSVDKFNTYGAELKDTGQLYQNKLVSQNNNNHNNNNNNSNNSNNMTVLLIVSIIIICIFIGVFCSVAIFYIRGNVANCQEVNRPRSSEIYATTQPTCTDNWSVGELSEPCKTPSSWETLNCKDMTVTLSKVDENTLNNKSKTYILTQPVKYPNTELMNTLPMAFSPMLNRNHKVNFITTCPSDNNSEQIGMETVCVPNEQHYDLQNNNDSIHHIYSRLPANIVNSDTGEAHTTYLAPYYQELYHPTLKPTYKTILRTPGQQISTSTPANRISNLKTHQTNFNLLQKSVKNESVQLNTFMPKTSLNKTNTEKVLEVNFNQSDSPRNGENIYDAKSINPSKCLDDKLISSLNDLHSCTVEGKTQFNDHRHQNTPTNIKILQPPLTPTQKSTYLLRSDNEQSECLECGQHKEQTSATSTL